MEKKPETAGLEHALALHRLGLRLVPLVGKAAFIKGWQELELGEADIRQWSRRGVNWGIITGHPLVVLDTDSDEAERWVKDKGIESPVTVQSGGGGFHRYFVCPEGIEIRSKSGLHRINGLDVKAWHSYIVAAGSIHPVTGRRYAYLPGKELRGLHELPLLDRAWVEERRPEPVGKTVPLAAGKPTGAIRDIFAYLLRIESVQAQGGSNGCYRVCCVLRDAGYSPLEAWPILLWWNERVPRPKWSVRELVHKLESVYGVPLRDVLER